MEFDPSARDGPPPRHAIESDSEDSDDGEGQVRGIKRQQTAAFQPPSMKLRSGAGVATPLPAGKPLVAFVGTPGESYLNSPELARFPEHVGLWVKEEQQAALHGGDDSILALVHLGSTLASQQAAFAYVAAALIETAKPSSIIIVDEYVPSLYLADADDDADSRARSDEPIRWLHAGKPTLAFASNATDLAPYQAPNYVTGMGAALLTEASIAALPATLLLLPRASTSNGNPYLQSAQLATTSADAAFALDARHVHNLTTLLSPVAAHLHTTERSAPSQPSLPTFLHDRRAAERKRAQRDISAMYM